MIRRITQLVFLVAAASLAPGLSLAAQPAATNALPAAAPRKQSGDTLLAKGKGLAIKRSDLDQAVARAEAQVTAKGRTVKPEQRVAMEQQVLEQLINVKLVQAKATAADKAAGKAMAEKRWTEAKAKAGSAEAFERQQKLMGATREQVIALWAETMTGEEVLKREFEIKVTDQDARKFYDENASQFDVPETVRASHILLLTRDPKTGAPIPADQQAAKRKRIEELLKRAKAEDDFAKLAREFSEDTVSKELGGEYTFQRGKMVPEVEAVAFTLGTNEISGIVTSKYGYHIVKLSEKIPAYKIQYAVALEDIKKSLTQREIEKQFPEYIAYLREEAGVEILDETLKKQEGLGAGFPVPKKPAQPQKSPPAK